MEQTSFLDKKKELIEKHLFELMPEGSTYGQIFESSRYALESGGKRLRPLLTLLTAEALGGDIQHALTPACCIEMIHTYSLIHDDLPCMDDDDIRRGKPTLHKVFSEGHALLTGDFLLTFAFEKISCSDHLSPMKKVQLISLLSKACGAEGLIGGQVLDITNKNIYLNLDDLKEIHLLKTAKLISVSLSMGAIIADASERDLKTINDAGHHLGLAFQIVDDILDVTASESKHGRKEGSDQAKGKSTYVTLLGVEGATRHAQDLLDWSLDLLGTLPLQTTHLENLARLLVHRSC